MKQLILNPVENLPWLITDNKYFQIHGLYVSDKQKNKEATMAFSGRDNLHDRLHAIYAQWAEALEVQKVSMRLLSGLHAHIILFMGLGKVGDKVLFLPEIAGGHYATKKILERLGYEVIEMIPDYENLCIDKKKTKQLMKEVSPDFIFVDRSEGLNYEDFSFITEDLPETCCAIYDASQYLTNILMKDFKSPFDMGFHIVMATLHKNIPGPQKAMVCSKDENNYWTKIVDGMNAYVSNFHIDNILLAGDILEHRKLLEVYSRDMLKNAILLHEQLTFKGLPVVPRDSHRPSTHHIWLRIENKEEGFNFYKRMEECNILVNYRKLPYHLGQGIRLGTSAATLQGVNPKNISELAELIYKIYVTHKLTPEIIRQTQNFIHSLIPLTVS